jgi:hypothetical protein
VNPEDADQTALELLIAYIRQNYAPASPTRRLLAAYEAQTEENARLRSEVASLRQCLALANAEPTEAQVEGWRAAADEEAH